MSFLLRIMIRYLYTARKYSLCMIRYFYTARKYSLFFFPLYTNTGGGGGGGGAVAQSVERATPGEEVPGSISGVAARSLMVGSV